MHVLRGIDLERVTVDVIVIELDGADPSKDRAVREYLTARGYEIDSPDDPSQFPLYSNRNGWFVRKEARASLRSQPGYAAFNNRSS